MLLCCAGVTAAGTATYEAKVHWPARVRAATAAAAAAAAPSSRRDETTPGVETQAAGTASAAVIEVDTFEST
jgi:hypothetical protein